MKHPKFDKKINENYYGAPLNKFVSERCKREMVVNNIDLIFNYYKSKNGLIRIIESKYLKESISKGQKILLQKISKKTDIECFVVFGDYPYEIAFIYSIKTRNLYKVDESVLISFLNNEILEHDLMPFFIEHNYKLITVKNYK